MITLQQGTIYLGTAAPSSGGGGSGEAVWGDITGTLSDQTDLQTALDAKQDELTAGTGIDIIANTISTTFHTDEQTIIASFDDELQVIGVKNPQTEEAMRIWNGTEQQWEQGQAVLYFNWQAQGIKWNRITQETPSGAWQCLEYGNGYFVAITSGGNDVIYSSDGKNWTRSSINSESWQSVCYGDNKFVAISNDNGVVGCSTDNGDTWNYYQLPQGYSDWNEVAYSPDLQTFVAVRYANSDGYGAYSTDGENWSLIFNMPQVEYTSVCYGNGKFVAVAQNTDIVAYSSDGSSWSSSTMPVSREWNSVCYGNGKFVAVAYDSDSAAYSIDGIGWTYVQLPRSDHWDYITYGNGYFMIVSSSSNGITLSSTDGETWTEMNVINGGDFHKVKYGDGKFITLNIYSGDIFECNTSSGVINVYTTDFPADEFSTLYDAPGVKSEEKIITGGYSTIETDIGITYTRNAAGDEVGYISVGEAHPEWICNINEVGVKVGDTIVATANVNGATGSFTTSDNKTVTVVNGIITEIVQNDDEPSEEEPEE